MKRKSGRRALWIAVTVVLVAAVIWFVGTRRSGGGNYHSETARVQDLSTYLSFSGHLRADDTKDQIAKKAMKVDEVYVSEGDRVDENQPLFRTTDGERVRAEQAGTIESLPIEEDVSLSPGAPIATIVDYDKLIALVDVDEYDVGALKLGDELSVYVSALDATLTGVVADIARDATVGSGVSYYPTKLELPDDERLRAGMSVDAELLTKSAQGAVTVPMEALQFDEANLPYLYLRNEKGELYVRRVELGIDDGVRVQIASGLAAGEQVYWPATVQMVTPYQAARTKK